MDGELDSRQSVELKRLLENSSELRGRLRCLKNVRNLAHHLPREDAPVELSQQIRSMLERKALFGEGLDRSEGTRRVSTVLFQKIRAFAAILALGAVLSLLVYSIVSPVDPASESPVADKKLGPVMPIQGPMRGKLELVCAAMPSVDSFLMRSVQFNDLSSCVQRENLAGRSLYYVSCHREDVKHLLSALNSVWHQFDETAFYVNTGELGEMIRVSGASVSQVASLINEQDVRKRIEHAKLESVRNSMRSATDSGSMMASLEDKMTLSALPPRPMLTSGEPNRTSMSESPEPCDRVELTIVLRQSPM
ncbi:MAG: hypothetical protein HQ515_11835, partial [Phycisphaeraceae bacterium]|nr:hypothetical protein [Phycisphaeraceae bacterium]